MTNKKTKKVKKVKKITPKTVKSDKVERDPHEIIQRFQKLLVEADNFPRADSDTSYKQFWLGLRKEGPEMLGITKAILTELEKSIKALAQAQTKVLQLDQELEGLKKIDGTTIHGMLKK